ncbi:MAG: lysine 2,3-aminomutase [Gemmatimonadetes bacterium]|nr:lysine 2,3-aminomutase [Gemmatimonadota bacterium]HCK11750.1 KamA family radical SAM protein [Candidatus Latescibacterota bacterium]
MSVQELGVSIAPQCAEPPEAHRVFRRDEFWRAIPGYAEVDAETFNSHTFQMRNSVTSVAKLMAVLKNHVDSSFFKDLTDGLSRASMSMRLSPYLVSLIDWDNRYDDPIRKQFLPLGSSILPDHPELHFDSLHEQADAAVPGLTHRYPDRALFLTLDTCPVYCRFCTRSYAVGLDTEEVEKVHLAVNRERWDRAFEYIRVTPQLEDIVISGGDTYNLRPEQLTYIGESLLEIDHVRRMRFASKGPAVMPQKLLTDDAWTDALVSVVNQGRAMNKEVVLHAHFNHPNEITGVTLDAMNSLHRRGVTIRNQAVLQRGVNDNSEVMKLLVKRLSYMNIQSYYVFFHDLVAGVEDLRTTLQSGLDIEKCLRGVTAGYNTPTFVVDTLGGGGKRDAHSYEAYDEENGIAVFSSPTVRPGELFYYFDPIDTLSAEARMRWADEATRKKMMRNAMEEAKR